jgi:hypothetical protein
MHSNDKIRKCRSILEPCLALNATQTTLLKMDALTTGNNGSNAKIVDDNLLKVQPDNRLTV